MVVEAAHTDPAGVAVHRSRRAEDMTGHAELEGLCQNRRRIELALIDYQVEVGLLVLDELVCEEEVR